MILDMTNLFSDAQAITSAANSTNVIDRGPRGIPKHGQTPGFFNDLGKGSVAHLLLRPNVTFSGGSVTQIRLLYQTSETEDFSGSPKTVLTLIIPVASFAVGNRFGIPLTAIPVGADRRYHRLRYEPLLVDGSAGTLTAGAITAGVVAGREEWWT
jgi:hypothetical protein